MLPAEGTVGAEANAKTSGVGEASVLSTIYGK